MGFIDRGFTTLLYEEESREPERVIIISCEGTNTEPEYFETIKEKLSDYISVLLEIKIVPKPSNASEPKDVVCNLEQFIIDQYDYKSDYDEMWVIWDREKVEHRKANILKGVQSIPFHIGQDKWIRKNSYQLISDLAIPNINILIQFS